MSRTLARCSQADLARSIRAAKQAGAWSVELRPDGTILIRLTSEAGEKPTIPVEDHGDIVL
jgi:hypothetical protein